MSNMPSSKAQTQTQQQPKGKTQICKGCNEIFPSKNSLFRHLRQSAKTCLPNPKDYDEFIQHVVHSESNMEKIAVLYGYIPSFTYLVRDIADIEEEEKKSEKEEEKEGMVIKGGEEAAKLVLLAIRAVSWKGATFPQPPPMSAKEISALNKISRSYGNISKNTNVVAQDVYTGAITEVLTAKAPPFISDKREEEEEEEWIANVNEQLSNLTLEGKVKVFGRISISNKKFNAELDVTHRRMEYLIPADFLFVPSSKKEEQDEKEELQEFFDALVSFQPGNNPYLEQTLEQSQTQTSSSSSPNNNIQQQQQRPSPETLTYLYKVKKLMKKFTTQIIQLDIKDESAVLEKQFHQEKRRKQKKKKSKSSAREEKQKRNQSVVGMNKKEEEEERGDGKEEQEMQKQKRPRKQEEEEEKEEEQEENFTKNKTSSNNNNNNKEKQKNKKNKKNNHNQKQKKSNTHVLKRRRFHNFTSKVMAHEFLAYRRLDRFYHRATLRFHDHTNNNNNNDDNSNNNDNNNDNDIHNDNDAVLNPKNRPFLALSLTGDLFLNGQVVRVIGLFIAILRGTIDEDILDCVFDEEYTNLVPVLSVPNLGLYAEGSTYMSWEGKIKAILSPRRILRNNNVQEEEIKKLYKRGWNEERTIASVQEFQKEVHWNVASAWCKEGVEKDSGRLVSERMWTKEVLEPWAVRAKLQLEDYRKWKEAKRLVLESSLSNSNYNPNGVVNATATTMTTMTTTIAETLLPPLESVDASVPAAFEKVLKCLRDADASGLWPTTTPKRQLVMVSTTKQEDDSTNTTTTTNNNNKNNKNKNTPLSVAHMRAKNNKETRSSAYSFVEGQGGASGSFSIGAMPGRQCEQPKGNSLFPDLMKAAFELEILLCPDREPSSTIAVNRNSQFRPHTDSGAGAGQSTSLIVGLGTYSGGELMVEGEKRDIRYNAVEFDGWKQRHWTLPFLGERFSLVWFTPKGCEGVRGIDLCS